MRNKLIAHREVRLILKRLVARWSGVKACQILDESIDREVRMILDLFYDGKNQVGGGKPRISTENKKR